MPSVEADDLVGVLVDLVDQVADQVISLLFGGDHGIAPLVVGEAGGVEAVAVAGLGQEGDAVELSFL